MSTKRIAIVTGAAGGMGSAIVQRLVADGYHVAALDLNAESLRVLEADGDGAVSTYQCDQTDEAKTRSVVARIQSELGPVYALVNAIGYTHNSRFMDENSTYWSKVIAINFQSLLYITHAVLPQMAEQKAGKIVNIASDAGRIGTGNEAVYAGAKGAVIAWSKSMARELARFAINVNVIAPGPTETPMLKADREENPEMIERMTRLIPFRRVAMPEDIAAAISFFCSNDSNYITGQTLSVSGGLTMA